MLNNFERVVFSILAIYITKGHLQRAKRADIDLQTCIDNFDIHNEKIIRVQDSRNMGAKYLNETELGTRQDCLKWCCETDNCDVFVYEDKNAGSCYLFHCGPPEDFKCKFTHHVSYSSAVLAINRRLPDLESQMKLTKHEQDLTKLRKTESQPEVIQQFPEVKVTSPTTTTTVKSVEDNVKHGKNPIDEERKCSRYQFECRSTKECIAIYNACDGIPQCADGSDEAPELGCPDVPTTSSPVLIPSPPRYDQNIPDVARAHAAPQPPPQYFYRPQIRPESGPIPPSGDYLRAAPDPNGRIAAAYEPVVQYGPQMTQQANNWGQNGHVGIAPGYNADKNSHIFNHKENGLQLSDGEISGQNQYSETSNFPKGQNYYSDVYRQTSENWPQQQQQQAFQQQDEVRYDTRYAQDSTIKNWKVENTPPASPVHVQEQMAHELKHSKETYATPEPAPKIELDVKRNQHKHYPEVVAYRMEETDDLKDGLAETPGGAVLSLTLGLIITCIMAILIGCRLRVVRRRMRKSGKAYAHDADYLVNGMYL